MKKQDQVSRRTILKGAAAVTAASTFDIVKAESVRGTAANSMVEVGFIGCGGQGTRDATLLEATGKAKIVALADYFQDQLDKAKDKFKVDATRAHVGIDAYKEVIGSKVDAVLLVTPPGFRPEHFKAAAAGSDAAFRTGLRMPTVRLSLRSTDAATVRTSSTVMLSYSPGASNSLR